MLDRFATTDKPADEFLRLTGHANDTVGLLDDGSLLIAIALDGRPMGLMDEDTRYAARRGRHASLRSLFDTNVTIYETHVCHDRVEPFRTGYFWSAYGRDLIADYHASLGEKLFAREWFLFIVVHPRPIAGLMNRLRRKIDADDGLMAQAEEKAHAAMSTLRDYHPRRLGTRWKKGVSYSEIGEAVRLVLYARWSPVPRSRGHMAGTIYTDRVVCGLLGFDVVDQHLGVMFGFRDYPEQVKPWVLDGLLDVRCRIVMTNRYQFRSAAVATGLMARTQRQMENARDRATSLKFGLDDAMDEIESGRGISGDHTWSLAVHSDTREDLASDVGAVKSVLANTSNISATTEAIGTFPAYWAQVPGASQATKARHGLISGFNFTSFSSLNGFPRGNPEPHWDHLFRVVTVGHTAHDFDPHVRRVGHTILIGPSGFGKSTLIGLTAVSLEQAIGPTGGVCVILDKDGSNELAVLATGGYYVRIRRGVGSGMAPLKALDCAFR